MTRTVHKPTVPPTRINSYDDWRELIDGDKETLTNAIVKMLLTKKHKQQEVADEIGVSRHIITRLAENNGLARKGKYKGKIPPEIPNPLITDIDASPDPLILQYGADKTVDMVDSVVEEEFELSPAKPDTVENIQTDKMSLSELMKQKVLPDLKHTIYKVTGSTLQQVTLTTDDGDFIYKVPQ